MEMSEKCQMPAGSVRCILPAKMFSPGMEVLGRWLWSTKDTQQHLNYYRIHEWPAEKHLVSVGNKPDTKNPHDLL